ncbi:adenylate/guanylate cyclase domain-containing protein [Methanobacterium formicicum]|uniref:adenylate/guanylate cyclase domain-containing protein n=1 Tax=Methanobacterium formicicum TaxID=2162 RepID=UPI0024123D84|nr:adenylate/guanylate cyclase domain-containing protein [Methanobacterium formicicum]MDG3546259.1 adenylate/guanylate cyclase domain-containing protein [Methanobacterium formicicum]
MEANHINYDYEKSFERIDKILETSDNSFEELKEVPSRDKLTYTNGFYVDCSALFVDIRNSSDLTSKHKRPKLAKLYRAYISEIVAVMNGNDKCAEISIIGDCVSGIFDTPIKSDIRELFSTGARIGSLIKTLNCKLRKKSIEEIKVGIGIAYGRALMVKAGYSGSGINDIVWMGDVVNKASKLANYGNQTISDKEMMVSNSIYINLDDHRKSLLEWNFYRDCYHGNVIRIVMEEWYNKNCK